MQLRFMFTSLLIALFAVGIMSVGIVGCGSDDEEETAESPTATPAATSSADEGPIVASRPIDFEAEKAALQEVFTAFYEAFNDNDIKAIAETFDTGSIVFGTIFAGNEPVPVAEGWNDVKIGIEGLWIGIGTKGAKWGTSPQLTDFWIRRKEASAVGYNCYKGAFPGETHLYFVKKGDEWLIQQLDSVTQNNLTIFSWKKADPRIDKFFSTEKDRAP